MYNVPLLTNNEPPLTLCPLDTINPFIVKVPLVKIVNNWLLFASINTLPGLIAKIVIFLSITRLESLNVPSSK